MKKVVFWLFTVVGVLSVSRADITYEDQSSYGCRTSWTCPSSPRRGSVSSLRKDHPNPLLCDQDLFQQLEKDDACFGEVPVLDKQSLATIPNKTTAPYRDLGYYKCVSTAMNIYRRPGLYVNTYLYAEGVLKGRCQGVGYFRVKTSAQSECLRRQYTYRNIPYEHLHTYGCGEFDTFCKVEELEASVSPGKPDCFSVEPHYRTGETSYGYGTNTRRLDYLLHEQLPDYLN